MSGKPQHDEDRSELDVQIVAQNPNSEMRVFAVPATHPLVAAWSRLRTKIIDLLRHYEFVLYCRLAQVELKDEIEAVQMINNDFALSLHGKDTKTDVKDIRLDMKETKLQLCEILARQLKAQRPEEPDSAAEKSLI